MRKIAVYGLLISLALFPILALTSTPVLAACAAPVVKTLPGANTGEVYLWWNLNTNVDHYNIIFGNKSNKYPMGALNIGESNAWDYTVGHLDVRKKYFFRIVAVCDGAETWSNEVYSYPRKRPI